uniref:N-acetylphosphatidylethanolamine-hydrolyzing phospholipase D n=1 Tax=Romanomermis culicivorax TaxID=13658 RepID=A0A915K4P6_ROMCU
MAEVEKAEPIRTTNGGFENPWSTWQGLPNMKEFFKWILTRKERCAKTTLEEQLPVMNPNFAVEDENLRATWLGHATVLIQMERICVLTDPCFSPKCSPISIFGPQRIRPPPCSLDDLPKVDAVLISHNHYDHLDSTAVRTLNARFGADLRWYVPLGLKEWFCNVGCFNVAEFNWWQEDVLTTGDNTHRMVCLPSQHWSCRNGFDRNRSLWCSWAVIGARHRFYFAGDTGYFTAFASIGHFYGPFTLAAIPIGCYKPRSFMKSQHVCPEEAVKIHLDVKAKNSIGIHWGTYDMGSTEVMILHP